MTALTSTDRLKLYLTNDPYLQDLNSSLNKMPRGLRDYFIQWQFLRPNDIGEIRYYNMVINAHQRDTVCRVYSEIQKYYRNFGGNNFLGFGSKIDPTLSVDQQRLVIDITVAVFQVLWKETGSNAPISLVAYIELLSQVESQIPRRDTIAVWKAMAKQACIDISEDEIAVRYDSNPVEALGFWMDENQEDLANIKRLNLRSLKLTTLPPSVGKLTTLEHLYLSNNQLRELPSEFGNLPVLEELFLEHNLLKELPEEIGNLKWLDRFLIGSNPLNPLFEKLILQFVKLTDQQKEPVYWEVCRLAVEAKVPNADGDEWGVKHYLDDAERLEKAMHYPIQEISG